MDKNTDELSTEIKQLIDDFSVEDMDTQNTSTTLDPEAAQDDAEWPVANYDNMAWDQLYYTVGGGGGGSAGAAGDLVWFGGSPDTINLTTMGSSYNITMPYPHTSDFVFDIGCGSDDRITRLTKLEEELATEARLREEHPAVDELYQQYRLALALVVEKDCDQYFEERMRAFGGKVEDK